MPPFVFRLATYVNVAFGRSADRIGTLPEFTGGMEWVFLVPGPHGLKLRLVPDDWIATMRALGARRAWFGYGPTTDLHGEGVWTEGEDGFCFYRLTVVKVEDVHSRATLTGHRQDVPPTVEGVPVVYARLRSALVPMIELARQRGEFEAALIEALAILDGDVTPPASALEAFPISVYPPSHIRLFAAALRGDVFGTGGMGWWDDGPFSDTEFEATTQGYRNALYSAFVAASRWKIGMA